MLVFADLEQVKRMCNSPHCSFVEPFLIAPRNRPVDTPNLVWKPASDKPTVYTQVPPGVSCTIPTASQWPCANNDSPDNA
jgi:hypothetical protein